MTGISRVATYLLVSGALVFTVAACKKKSKKGGGSNNPPATEEVAQEGQNAVEANVLGLNASPSTPGIGEIVVFTGVCGQDNTGRLTWEFGDNDNGRGTGLRAVYRFNQAGEYTVTATCVEPDGATRTETYKITIGSVNGGNGTARPGQNPNQNGNHQCSHNCYHN